jgi:CheY-like chemotaxis protein
MSDTEPYALRVLVVDDDPDAAGTLALVLNLWCYEVRTAANGTSALEAGRTFLPDVILMDLGMPGLDGWEAARRLREEPGMRDSLFVALTGFGLDADRRRSREAGFDHHLLKPVEPEVLLRLLEDARLTRAVPACES